MTRPNVLGRVIRYVTDAFAYGGVSKVHNPKRKRSFFRPVLAEIAAASGTRFDTLDTDDTLRIALVSPWIYSDLKLLADRVASSELFVVQKLKAHDKEEEWEDETNHDLYRLFQKPNALMTGEFLTRHMVWWYGLLGNAFLFVSTEKAGGGTPQELWPLEANRVFPRPDRLREHRLIPGGITIDYEYWPINGQPVLLPGEHIMHFRTVNPFDYWMGLSPLSAAYFATTTDHSQSNWLRTTFAEDNAIPSAIISLPEELGDEEFDEAKRLIREDFGSGRRSAITRSGDMTVQMLSHTISELQVLDGMRWNRETIDRVYGIPDGIFNGNLSGDSRLAAETQLARNAVQPILNGFVKTLDTFMVPFYEQDGDDFRLEPDNVIPQDRNMDMAEYGAYSPTRTMQENRQELGLDELKFKDERLAPLQVIVDEVPIALLNMAAPLVMPQPQGGPGGPMSGGAAGAGGGQGAGEAAQALGMSPQEIERLSNPDVAGLGEEATTPVVRSLEAISSTLASIKKGRTNGRHLS